MISLINMYDEGGGRPVGATEFLYELMKERDPEINISHKELPTYEEHRRFVHSMPYRLWYLIEQDAEWVGYISATANNEIGIVLRKQYRGIGIGPEAVLLLMRAHEPNPHRASLCNGRWLANIAPGNERSRRMFEGLGFRKIQETFALQQEESHGQQDATQELHQEPPSHHPV